MKTLATIGRATLQEPGKALQEAGKTLGAKQTGEASRIAPVRLKLLASGALATSAADSLICKC